MQKADGGELAPKRDDDIEAKKARANAAAAAAAAAAADHAASASAAHTSLAPPPPIKNYNDAFVPTVVTRTRLLISFHPGSMPRHIIATPRIKVQARVGSTRCGLGSAAPDTPLQQRTRRRRQLLQRTLRGASILSVRSLECNVIEWHNCRPSFKD